MTDSIRDYDRSAPKSCVILLHCSLGSGRPMDGRPSDSATAMTAEETALADMTPNRLPAHPGSFAMPLRNPRVGPT